MATFQNRLAFPPLPKDPFVPWRKGAEIGAKGIIKLSKKAEGWGGGVTACLGTIEQKKIEQKKRKGMDG